MLPWVDHHSSPPITNVTLWYVNSLLLEMGDLQWISLVKVVIFQFVMFVYQMVPSFLLQKDIPIPCF